MMRRIRRGSDVGLARDFERAHRRRVHEFVHRGPDPLGGYLSDLFVHSLPMLLRFADRNSMAHSIETRMPFLDHRLVEFAFTVPPTAKIRRGLTKHLLRTALHGVLPDAVRTRADKMGFVAPEQVWMTEELDPLVRDVVASRTFRQRPYFDVARIDGVFARNEHRSRATARAAWRWINLELWLRRTAD
jgi:asparagine synthase (glutamine-hydrolysing)